MRFLLHEFICGYSHNIAYNIIIITFQGKSDSHTTRYIITSDSNNDFMSLLKLPKKNITEKTAFSIITRIENYQPNNCIFHDCSVFEPISIVEAFESLKEMENSALELRNFINVFNYKRG